MKYRILIADDEESIREGVADLIRRRCPRWEVDAQSRDGLEALSQAKRFLPHAVLTDISMPHMNGLDLLENLLDVLPDAKLLVLSGYDQFEFAVQALRLGVTDYLLKPLESDKLVALLDEIANSLDQENAQLEQTRYLHTQAQKASQLELNTYFKSAIRGAKLPPLSQSVAEYAAGSAYCCVLCNGMEERWKILDQLLDQRLDSSIRKTMLVLEPPAELAIIFWIPSHTDSDFFLNLNHALGSIAVQCRREMDQNVQFFIGPIMDASLKLEHSYKRSLVARNYAFPEDGVPVTTYEDVLQSMLMPCKRIPEHLKKEIPAAVSYGNKAAFFRCSQELFQWFRKENIRDATYMRMSVLSLCYGILNMASDYSMMSYYEFENVHHEVMQSRSMEELRLNFENMARLHWLHQQNKAQPRQTLADKVARIVQSNLSNMDFSLDDVASELFISPNYLRQLFKQETGQTFTEFLTAQRMQHAKLLLGIPKMRVSDAAEQCGYADSRYFSVCFKKHWHMTPSEYQESIAQIR